VSLKKCPRCRRYDVEWDPKRKIYRCLWKDCGWASKDYQDPGMTKEEIEKANKLADSMNLGKKPRTPEEIIDFYC